jgi:hypothetical protein
MTISKAALASAKLYNARQIRPSEAELACLVECWQAVFGLTRDGKFGPRTLESLASVVRAIEYGAAVEPYYSDVPVRPKLEVPDTAMSLSEIASLVAIEEIGQEETEGQNRGPAIRRYAHPDRDGGSWCAYFVGYCYEEASRRLGVSLPFRRSGGAKRLTRNVGAVGWESRSLDAVGPGTLVCWDRGDPGSWHGHVAIAVNETEIVEGNVGPNGTVRRRTLTEADRSRLWMVAGLSR